MSIQIILCVETNKRADTDSVYISDVINYWYVLNNKIKITKIYMNTKSRYHDKEIVKEIDKKIKEFTIGITYVIYCIDTDQYEINTAHAAEFRNISQYCNDKKYDLIWFCHEIEEVFCGQKITDSQKVQEAAKFRRKKKIEEIHADKLSSDTKRAGTSNILNVLDKYLVRK